MNFFSRTRNRRVDLPDSNAAESAFSAVHAQVIEQGFGLLVICRVEALGELGVNLREHRAPLRGGRTSRTAERGSSSLKA
jgi:hypothetical protein